MAESEEAIFRAINAALGMAQAGRIEDAIRALESGNNGVLRHPAGHNVLGSLYFQQRRPADALRAFDAAVKMAPAYADAQCNRGVALQQLGRLPEALAAFDATLKLAQDHATALFNRGTVLKRLDRIDEAIAAFDRVVQVQPDLADARLNRGFLLLEREAFAEALADFDAVLGLEVGSIGARTGRASALMRLRRTDEAEATVDAALAANPGNVELILLRAALLVEEDRYAEALAETDRAMAAEGSTPRTLAARSAVLWKLGRFDESVAAREESMRLDPAEPTARETLGYLYLSQGDYARGFDAYETRLRRRDMRQRQLEQTIPTWRGEPLAGKRILVLSEQGNGDTLQFSRYLALLHREGAIITAVVQEPVLTLMRSMRLPVTWTAEPAPPGPFDFLVPLLSLPSRFGTRLETVPRDVPYLFADRKSVAEWRATLGAGGFKVGIAWQGTRSNLTDARRSIPLRHYQPLGTVPGVRLISIQAVNGLEQLASLPAGMKVEELGDKVTANRDGIAEIAAVIGALDLIVTSDAMTAHLAGALGAPVWVALNHDPEWRWLRDRADSPWYPTARLFRQAAPGDWPGVFGEMATALREISVR